MLQITNGPHLGSRKVTNCWNQNCAHVLFIIYIYIYIQTYKNVNSVECIAVFCINTQGAYGPSGAHGPVWAHKLVIYIYIYIYIIRSFIYIYIYICLYLSIYIYIFIEIRNIQHIKTM
jgi:hypothetical protein